LIWGQKPLKTPQKPPENEQNHNKSMGFNEFLTSALEKRRE
jgi:hypothetical protein